MLVLIPMLVVILGITLVLELRCLFLSVETGIECAGGFGLGLGLGSRMECLKL
jgi:hypothetical protein